MFTGKERDTESGLDYFGARYFTAASGRFNSPDPANAGAELVDPRTWNGYAYVRSNPLNAVDPTGLSDIVFDGAAQTITVLPNVYDELGVRDAGKTFCAANNVYSHDSIGKLLDGLYPFAPDTSTRPGHHSPTLDSRNGPFGPGGIFRLVPFTGADGKLHVGVGLHAGRANTGGYKHATNGCIRTTEDAIAYITRLAAYDPLNTLAVVNNRNAPTNSRGSANSTISYGPPGAVGSGWDTFDLLQLILGSARGNSAAGGGPQWTITLGPPPKNQ